MIRSSQSDNDNIYLSYNKILNIFDSLNITTKSGKKITYYALSIAIRTMMSKHPNCRWKITKEKRNKCYILIEGYYWLKFVYFQKGKSLIDADISFFEDRIKQYEELLNLNSKTLWNEDLKLSELEKYFDRSYESIRKAISKMLKINKNFWYLNNNQYYISKYGIEWLCKNCFKHKYLSLLEDYKMELTEIYIERGHPYDIW